MKIEFQKIVGQERQDVFGYAVALGDINGDGYKEVIVASISKNKGGVIFIFSSQSFKILKKIDINKKKINTIRLICKDINDDHVDELIIAVTYQDLSGEVKIISLKSSKTLYHWKSLAPYDAFGFAIASGDVDGDGIADMVISAPHPVKNGKGKVYVYSGKDGSLLKEFSSIIPRGSSDFGTSVATGDIDGDGLEEVIIGAPGLPKGEVFVYSGKFGWLLHKLTGEPGFGFTVHTDDINGDHFNELIVTTKNLEGNKVSVFQNFYHLYDIENDEVDIGFGETIATGDINGDGKKELILGAFDARHLRKRFTGQVNVYDGENGKLLNRWFGKEEKSQFGFSLSSASLDHKGHDVLLIGTPREMQQKKGIVYLVSMKPEG